jgi:hypothetical protein
MTRASQNFGNLEVVTQINNNGGNVLTNCQNAALFSNSVTSTSGALTSNTLATVLSVSGRGKLNFLTAYTNDVTSRTLRLKITVDGNVISDKTSSTISASNSGLVPVGVWNATSAVAMFQPIKFYQSLLIEWASSLNETGKFTAGVNYEVWQ